MCDRSRLCQANRGLLLVLATVLLIALFLGIPGNLKSYSGETEELHFCILHTNDMQSALIPHSAAVDYNCEEDDPAIGGFARLATAVDEIREHKMREGEPVLLFDAGDFVGGSAFAWLALRGCAPELTIMQNMGYDAVAIGNHEYDYGPDVLAQYLLKAGYPEAHQKTLLLASNTEAPSDHPLAAEGLYRKSGMFELENGVKVGTFGLIGEGALLLLVETGDMQFLDQHETARRMVDELREQGADVIVALSHCGLAEDQELAREVPGIDVIVGGHSETVLYKPVLQGATIIVQAGSLGRYLGQLEVAYNSNNGQVRVRNEENDRPFLIPIDDSFACDPKIDALIQQYTVVLDAYIEEMTGGKVDDMMSTVARSDFILSNQPPLNETPLGNFVADSMRTIAQQVIGRKIDAAGEASGCIRKSIFPGTTEQSGGNVSFYEIVAATGMGHGLDGYPGCPIISLYLTGEEVRRLLEMNVLSQEFEIDPFFLQISGLRYSYNPANAVLLTIPFIELPIPTTRAVTKVEFYTGDGIQPVHGEGYASSKRGDEKLYHVVTDAYILFVSSKVRHMLPQVEVFPKNADGEPVPPERYDELIVHQADGTELKVWEAVVMYAAAQASGADGMSQLPSYYAGVAGRITEVWTFPLTAWLLLILAAIVAGVTYLILRRKKRRISSDTTRIKPTTD